MSRTNQPEFATERVPEFVWVAKPRHMDSVEDSLPLAAEKMGSGRAFLKVVAYPWGVEFDVCDGGENI